jgi:hypothetical protein
MAVNRCQRRAKPRDITLLYNLPTGVAAGPGAAELEAQLQQERERTARLQEQLQVRMCCMKETDTRGVFTLNACGGGGVCTLHVLSVPTWVACSAAYACMQSGIRSLVLFHAA